MRPGLVAIAEGFLARSTMVFVAGEDEVVFPEGENLFSCEWWWRGELEDSGGGWSGAVSFFDEVDGALGCSLFMGLKYQSMIDIFAAV